MSENENVITNEDIIKKLGPSTAKKIRVKSEQMEERIARKLASLDTIVEEGYSSQSEIKITVDGNRKINSLTLSRSYGEWQSQEKTINLIIEAVNNAIENVNESIVREISTIKYAVLDEICQECEQFKEEIK